MAESKRDEHKRLQKRTDALKEEHAGLSRTRTPFDKAAHDQHTERLHEHKKNLAKHRQRGDDE